MRKLILLLVAIFVLPLTGCFLLIDRFTTTQPFDAALTQQLMQPGNNTVKGSALMRKRNGAVVTCAGSEVSLIPSTPYSDERMRLLFESNTSGYNPLTTTGLSQRRVDPTDPEYLALRGNSYCDAQGYFKFENVADGTYYVATMVYWNSDPRTIEGATLMRRVSVRGGETKEVVLTGN